MGDSRTWSAEDWKAWQAFLKVQGFSPGPVDGIPGERTKRATQGFQYVHKLSQDGIVGPATFKVAYALGFRSESIQMINEQSSDLICLAFCVITETNRKEEMPYVAGCIMNRVEDGYRGRTVKEVVLAPYQFSRFNGKPKERLALESDDPASAVADLISSDKRYSQKLYDQALEVGRSVLSGNNPWRDGTVSHSKAPKVHHYYSPISMSPPGAKPSWFDASKEILVPSIPAERFRWFYTIP